jgi:hypothetical protein
MDTNDANTLNGTKDRYELTWIVSGIQGNSIAICTVSQALPRYRSRFVLHTSASKKPVEKI